MDYNKVSAIDKEETILSKLNNLLRIVNLLRKEHKRLTAIEIGERLNLSESSIRRLINSIDYMETGIKIDVYQGKSGGFELSGDTFLSRINLIPSEYKVLEEAKMFLSKKSGFQQSDIYTTAIEKVMTQQKIINIDEREFQQKILFRGYNQLTDEEASVTRMINVAMKESTKVKISYYSLAAKSESVRIIHPYQLYTYKGFNYLVAYCEKRHELRDFKITRIRNIRTTQMTFIRDKKFIFDEFVKDTFGIYKGERYLVKLKIKYPHSELIKESLYHPNQNIKVLEDGSIHFEAKMKGKEEIITWILSMGDCVDVIEPEVIKEDLKKIYQNIFKSFDK